MPPMTKTWGEGSVYRRIALLKRADRAAAHVISLDRSCGLVGMAHDRLRRSPAWVAAKADVAVGVFDSIFWHVANGQTAHLDDCDHQQQLLSVRTGTEAAKIPKR
jgi:hypothetical protein